MARSLTLLLLVPIILSASTCSASAIWPGDEAYGFEPLSPASALLDPIDHATLYAPPDTFTPLDLSLDEPSAATSASHSFTPLSLHLDPPSASDPSYHHFLALGTTAGYDESFYMSGTYHTLTSTSPTTFNDVAMSIRETAVDGDGGAGEQYGGVLSMTVKCANGSLTLLYDEGIVIEDGDAVLGNDTFTFTNVTFTGSVDAANNALSSFTFIPASSVLPGNVSCPYLILTNQSLYTGQFIFDLTDTPLPAPAATVARVSFNLTVVPNATELYALYTGLPADVAGLLNVSQARIDVVETVVDVQDADTAVVMDFLPLGWHVMQVNQNDSVAELVAAFIALTPAQLSQTKWMRYVQPDSITQLCSDGSYRTSCVVVAPAAVIVAATAVTSSLAFIVAMSVGGTLLVLATAGAGWRYAIKRREPSGPPLSPLLRASLREELIADMQPTLRAGIYSSPDSLAILQDGLPLGIDDQLVVEEDDDAEHVGHLSRLSSARRASKRRSLVQFAPPQPGGAKRLELDVLGRLRAGGLGEGRRYIYQPQLVVNDTRAAEIRERRQSLVQQLEERQRERVESERGSLVHEAYVSPATFSTRSSLTVLSPMRASLTAAAMNIPAMQIAGGRKHLHYGDDDESEEDEDGSEQYTEGPKFIDASSATVTTSPQPQQLASFASPSGLQPDTLTAVVPSFPHPSTFLPPHVESKRSSAAAMRRRSISGGLLSQLDGEDGAFDGLHVGYSGGDGSGANTPSLSTQDIANEWLVEDDAGGLDRLEQGTPDPLRRMLSDAQQQSQQPGKSPPAVLTLQSHDAKRGSWARENAKRQSYSNKRNSGRANIVLDLSNNDINISIAPHIPVNYNNKAKAVAAPTSSIWSKLGIGSSSRQSGGMVKEAALNRPLMRPLMANAPLHHPRLSLYQQRAVY